MHNNQQPFVVPVDFSLSVKQSKNIFETQKDSNQAENQALSTIRNRLSLLANDSH
jgi:hypothetical protein